MAVKYSKRSWLAGLFFAIVTIVACDCYLQWNSLVSSSASLLVWLITLTFASAALFSQKNRRMKLYSLVFGWFFAAAQICGARLETLETLALNGQELVLMLVCITASAPAAGSLFAAFIHLLQKSPAAAHKHSSLTVFLSSAAILYICWLPYLAAFYPGLFTYDVSYQYLQYEAGKLNMHHPLLHTLMIGGFYDLGWYLFGYPVKGILMYALFQMGLLALAIAASISCLYRWKAPFWCCILALVCGAFLPFNTLLSISTTKDTLFAASVLWLTVLAFEFYQRPELFKSKVRLLCFLLALLLTALLRNNGFICIGGLAFAGVCLLRHNPAAFRRLIVVVLCSFIAYSSINWGLKTITNAEKGPGREMYSVPIQQLARVYVMTDDAAKPEIVSFLPTAANYACTISDPVKNTFVAEQVSIPDFLQLWARVGLRHPIIYLEAFAETTRGFWHFDVIPTGQYLETAFHTDEGNWLVEESKWPWLMDQMSRLYSKNEYRQLPLISSILTPAFWCWALVLVIFAALYLRKKSVIFASLAVFALYLTTLLGPCVMFRYIYPVAICIPFLLGALHISEEPQ